MLKRALWSRRRLSTERSIPKSKGYSDTVILPRPAFDLKANPARQAELYGSRTTEELYKWQAEQLHRPLFVLHDGPPYANGSLHLGHVLNKALKDIINRYKVMRGYRVHYETGWDCHGLPIENKALAELKTDHRALTPSEIRSVARKTAEAAIELQREEFKKLHLMTDWSKGYKTFNKDYEIKQLEIFREMVKKGLLYRAFKPVYYSPSSRTALAEGELEYNEKHKSLSVYVEFPVINASESLASRLRSKIPDDRMSRLLLVIWTTTPWTLPSNMAVAVSETMEYCIVTKTNRPEAEEVKYYLVALNRLDSFRSLLHADLEIVDSFSGSDILGTTYLTPFAPSSFRLPVISSPYVKDTSGTGLVHTAPAHGMDDYIVYQRYLESAGDPKASFFNPVDEDGCYSQDLFNCLEDQAHAKRLVGLPVLSKGNKEVVAILASTGHLIKHETIVHSYPCDWRTKEPVIVRATSQWFANLDQVKEQAEKALQHVTFHPQAGLNRLISFIRGRTEWCISRQRAWGVPIPILYKGDEPLIDLASIDRVINVLQDKGIDHWWTGPEEDFRDPGANDGVTRGKDTMDVWFDSGVSWTSLPEDVKQADVYLEGSDQHRGWFQSSLLTKICATSEDRAPYKQIITHGFVLDENGRKMSKSLGNVIGPEKLLAKPTFGPDGLRLWAASVDYTGDVTMGKTVEARTTRSLQQIRQTLRFLSGNLATISVQELDETLDEPLSMLDKYVLHQLHELLLVVTQTFDSFAFNRGLQAISDFTSNTLSALYFSIAKDSLYSDLRTSGRRSAILHVFRSTLESLNSMIAPITPLLAEEVADSYAQASQQSVLRDGWPEPPASWYNPLIAGQMDILLSVRDQLNGLVEEARNAKHIRTSAEVLMEVMIEADDARHALAAYGEDIQTLFQVSEVKVVHSLVNPSDTWCYIGESRHGMMIRISKACQEKCPRCRNHYSAVKDTLCKRCEQVMSSQA